MDQNNIAYKQYKRDGGIHYAVFPEISGESVRTVDCYGKKVCRFIDNEMVKSK